MIKIPRSYTINTYLEVEIYQWKKKPLFVTFIIPIQAIEPFLPFINNTALIRL